MTERKQSPLRPPPLPSDLTPTLEPPPAPPTDRAPAPDRIDEVLSALARIEQAAVDRDRMLADAILGSNNAIREELNVKLDGVAHTARKALEATEECRKEIRASHLWLDEWAKSHAADLDRRLQSHADEIRGIVSAVSRDVTEQKAMIAETQRATSDHAAAFKRLEAVAQRSYDLQQAQGADAADTDDYADAAERATRVGD